MKTRNVAILMTMLSLAAAAAHLVAGAVDVDVIRLPSDGAEGLETLDAGQTAAVEAAEERKKEREEDAAAAAAKDRDGGGTDEETRPPWPCCNNALCTKSFPPTCSCLDVVEVCSGACQHCERSGQAPFGYVCNDQYQGNPAPTCSKDDDDDVPSGASRPVAAAAWLLFAFVALLFIVPSC